MSHYVRGRDFALKALGFTKEASGFERAWKGLRNSARQNPGITGAVAGGGLGAGLGALSSDEDRLQNSAIGGLAGLGVGAGLGPKLEAGLKNRELKNAIKDPKRLLPANAKGTDPIDWDRLRNTRTVNDPKTQKMPAFDRSMFRELPPIPPSLLSTGEAVKLHGQRGIGGALAGAGLGAAFAGEGNRAEGAASGALAGGATSMLGSSILSNPRRSHQEIERINNPRLKDLAKNMGLGSIGGLYAGPSTGVRVKARNEKEQTA